MALHDFVSGESAQVAENLDANFQYLFQLILSSGFGGSLAKADGTSTAQATGVRQFSGIGAAVGTSTALGNSLQSALRSAVAAATGAATATAVSSTNTGSVATATGTSTCVGFENAGTTATASATGTSTVAGTSNVTTQQVATATGTSTATAISNKKLSSVATATGVSTAVGASAGAPIESSDGATNVGPSSPIFASTTPGTTSGSLNTFNLTASPGIVVVNGFNDTTVANPVELYYLGHVVYAEDINGGWFRWVSANTWSSTASPVPVFITESVEGLFYTTAGPIIYASSVAGSAAPTGSTVGSGLTAWNMTANPGQLQKNTGAGPVTETLTANVIEMYYHNHTLWHQNSALDWFTADGGPLNGYTQQATGPVPTTPVLNVATIGNQNINTTFTVSGSYQDFTGAGNPTLQYSDNFNTGAATTTWNPADKSTSITLGNSNQSATSTLNAGSSSVRSSTSFNTGKRIFEVTGSTLTANFVAGFANASFGLATGLGDTVNSFGFQPNWPSGSQAALFNAVVLSSSAGHNSANGDKITFAVDFDAQKVWVTSAAMRAAGNPWNNAVIGSQNPVGGVGGFSFAGATGPYFITFNEFDSGGAATLNTVGPYAVGIPTGFTSWDVGTASTWLPFPSTVAVTPALWSFVHPPVVSQNPSANVAVRDANATATIGISNTFQISTPGVVTLSPMTLSNSSVAAGQPSGTVVGTLTIPTSGGTFTGTVASNNSSFAVTGSGNTRSLVTTAVLAANAGIAIVLTATMSGAVNSGETLNATIAVTSESASATSVSTVGPVILGSNTPGVAGAQLTWGLTTAVAPATGRQITLAGVRQTITSAVNQIYYINHTLYQSFGSAPVSWAFYNGSAISGGQITGANFTASSTPIPNITLSGLSVPQNTNGPTGITASLISAGSAMSGVTWTEDSATFNFSGNQLVTTGAIQAGTYPINITATIA